MAHFAFMLSLGYRRAVRKLSEGTKGPDTAAGCGLVKMLIWVILMMIKMMMLMVITIIIL